MTSKASGNRATASASINSAINEFGGLGVLIQLGLNAAEDRKGRNRAIMLVSVIACLSISMNIVQFLFKPEPGLLSETADGRIRPVPLLSSPIYTHKEIMSWGERCVQKLYKLSYVDWRTTLQNDSFCLSDGGRASFTKSLNDIGVFKYLNPENQGSLYAVPGNAVMRQYQQNEDGYYEWLLDVPYKLVMDGRQKGTLEVVMTMRVRRVKMNLREDGLWVDEYVVKSARQN